MGVQGHQKQWENTKVLMEIDVFVCLVVQEPGVPGGLRPPGPPLRRIEPTAENCVQLRPAPPDVGVSPLAYGHGVLRHRVRCRACGFPCWGWLARCTLGSAS